MSPWLVDRTATPRPPSTLGSLSAAVYTRRPGLEIRRTPDMVRLRSLVYFIVISSVRPGRSVASETSKPSMYPSLVSTAARDSLSFDEGMRTVSCIATLALRIRVSMSAMGSVIVISRPPLPARLRHARNLTGVNQFTQADSAHAELAEHRMRPPAATATGVGPDLVLGLALGLDD